MKAMDARLFHYFTCKRSKWNKSSHGLNFNFRRALLQHQCIHNGIITENIIFFRIWRYFSHRASILCLNYIFFLHQHSLCSAACCNPFPPLLQLTPCYWLKRITHFLCNLNSLSLFKHMKHVTTAMLGMNEPAVTLSPIGPHMTCTQFHSYIFYIYYSDSLWSLVTEHNQLKESFYERLSLIC